MTVLVSPSDFFLANGGRAFLQANGHKGDLSLEGLYSVTWPARPKSAAALALAAASKPKVPRKARGGGPTTRLGSSVSTGLLIVTEGAIAIYSAAQFIETEGVTTYASLPPREIVYRAWDLMEGARPLLFVTIGGAYQSAVTTARLTLDPDLIESCGHTPFMLSRSKVASILEFSDALQATPAKLKLLKGSMEYAIAHSGRYGVSTSNKKTFRHPQHPTIQKQVRATLGLNANVDPALSEADFSLMHDYWAEIARLPLFDDASWTVADHITTKKDTAHA